MGNLIERADLPIRTVEFMYLMGGSAFLAGFIAAVAGLPSLIIIAVLAVGASIPYLVVYVKARRRLRSFENQLPDLLVTMAASLKAGHSFRQGLQAVVEEDQDPASKEFKRVLAETRLGRPMDDALSEMARRLGSKDFEFVITAVTIQRQVGGSLAGIFDMVADTVRDRQQFQRKIKGLTAMGRMSAYTLVGLPFFVLGGHPAQRRVHGPALRVTYGAHAVDRHARDDGVRLSHPQKNRLLQGVAVLFLLLGIASLGLAVFLVSEVATLPLRQREGSIRRAARYGESRRRVSDHANAQSFRDRALVPMSTGLARFCPPHQSEVDDRLDQPEAPRAPGWAARSRPPATSPPKACWLSAGSSRAVP